MTARRIALVAGLALGACGDLPALGSHDQAFAVAPAGYDFGAWMVGTTAPTRWFIVSPVGSERDVIRGITESCGDFDLDLSRLESPAVLDRGCVLEPVDPMTETFFELATPCLVRTQTFGANFHPSFPGPQSCVVTIDLATAPDLVLTLSGKGVPPPLALAVVTPVGRTLDFGDVVVTSDSAGLPITIRSDGSSPLDLGDATITGAGADAFALVTTDVEPIASGQTFTWRVACRPTVAGAHTATFTIPSNAPDAPHAIELTCNGIQSELVVAPSPIQFDETLVGAMKLKAVTLANVGTASLTFGALRVEGPFVVGAPGVPGLGLGESTDVQVTFVPTAADVGIDVRGTLTVPFGSETRTVDLVGPARNAILSLSPAAAVDFGIVCRGQRGEAPFTALNAGNGHADLQDAVVTGPGFSLMPVSPASFPAPLGPLGSSGATFRVLAMPNGEATGTLIVTTSIPASAPTVVPLHAIGQDGGVGVTPAAIDFGAVQVDQLSGGRTFRIDNCDPGPLEVLSASIVGPSAVDFIVVSDGHSLPTTLGSGEGAGFLVEMRPATGGDKAAFLQIVHGAGTTTIPLTGLALGGDLPDPADPRGSYYACAAGGGGAGLAPIVIALGLVRRRRRRAGA